MSYHEMENSRHDIFKSSAARQQPRRIVVSSNNTADKTGLCHSLAYDWATQNSSSTLSEQQYLFEISASTIKKDQTIEGAIKDQLFFDIDRVDEVKIGQLLRAIPDAITILVDGYDGQHAEKYGKSIIRVLEGSAHQEVTVMVTSRPRYAANLTRSASGVYDHIDMHDTSDVREERCTIETTNSNEVSTRMVQAHLERIYTDPKRFADGTTLRKRDFQPRLTRRDGSGKSYGMNISRHDIFASSTAGQQLRRIVVSGNNTADNTGLCCSLDDDWAVQNASSTLSEVQYLFEISASRIRENQTIEGAIKDQLFSDLDGVAEDDVLQILKDMPDAVTILVDGFDGKHIMKYGDNIMKVLTGRTLQEVTVMVTARPRAANELYRSASAVYDHIDMH